MNGSPVRTLSDQGNPANLIGKKLARNIPPGQTVMLQVQNPDGTLSDVFPFVRTQ
jgi:hypothetical protein